jgi:hypothetical protein
MKFTWHTTALFIVLSFVSIFAKVSLDPLWIYKDLPDSERLYNVLAIYDTSRSGEIGDIVRTLPTDTGDKYDSSYINFNYRFTTDTLYVVDKYSHDTTYRGYRPGYAGFKIDWDNGVTGFSLAKYKYLILAHKGPLPNHKVTMRFGYNTVCGSPTFFQTIGSFAASSIWKMDTISIPDSLKNIPDSAVSARNYYEMQVLITNASPTDTNKSSARGILKVDNIGFAGKTTGAINRSVMSAPMVARRSFIPLTNGLVVISAFSLNGELLYTTAVDVDAGKKYSINTFVKKHVPLSSSIIKCIKIKGAGIDILLRSK